MNGKESASGASGTAPGPLAGVRILDLTSVVLGPLATQILGDYGADVVKVENLEGDLARDSGVSLHQGMSSIFLAINRNKRSIAVDLKSPEGKAVLRRLLPGADVLVHNMRVAAIEKLGFGYDAVAELRPEIVYCAATGFGQDGPDRDKPAFDDIIQAACGLASVNSLGREQPDYVPTLIADKTTGMALVNAVRIAGNPEHRRILSVAWEAKFQRLLGATRPGPGQCKTYSATVYGCAEAIGLLTTDH